MLRKFSILAKLVPEGDDLASVLADVINGPDRLAIIMGTALLDRTLEQALLSVMEQDHNRDNAKSKTYREQMFDPEKGSAPLASMAAKTRLAHALGVFGPITREDLLKISRIRNLFAHSAMLFPFQTPEVSKVCFGLEIWTHYLKVESLRKYVIMPPPKDDNGRPRWLFTSSLFGIYFAFAEDRLQRTQARLAKTKLMLEGLTSFKAEFGNMTDEEIPAERLIAGRPFWEYSRSSRMP